MQRVFSNARTIAGSILIRPLTMNEKVLGTGLFLASSSGPVAYVTRRATASRTRLTAAVCETPRVSRPTRYTVVPWSSTPRSANRMTFGWLSRNSCSICRPPLRT